MGDYGVIDWVVGQRVRVTPDRPKGYSIKEWSLYADHRGAVARLAQHRMKNDAPILVQLDDGRRIWFSEDEILHCDR